MHISLAEETFLQKKNCVITTNEITCFVTFFQQCALHPGFEVKSLCRSLDFVNLMSYDLHGIWSDPPKTGHHAGLGVGGGAQQSVEGAVTFWKNE